MTRFISAFVLLITVSSASFGQDIVGKWKTIDDESGKPRSVVEIYQKQDKYYGKVVRIFSKPDEDPDPICDLCKGDRKNQKVIGMEIIRDMKPDGDSYTGGTIVDPENGSVYDCKIWIENGNLMLRGYLYFLYRTQTWVPLED